ncbi:hypothetical protein JCM19237_5527 [Photobacterium aphoticum]|uniref:Uncharacterized protein n=1 Tax=Photobacterium aphoticum TaxID=754436 RepID=A0A090QLE3_9GAMM|nr:hypothetical protein JCM19237_5527 [Photobacterium aphoticum]
MRTHWLCRSGFAKESQGNNMASNCSAHCCGCALANENNEDKAFLSSS